MAGYLKINVNAVILITCALLLAIHQLLQHVLLINYTLLDHYLDPLLSVLVVISILSIDLRSRCGFSGFSLIELIGLTICLSIKFEIVFPYFSSHFIYDPYDFLVYILGGLCYYLLTISSLSPTLGKYWKAPTRI
jgi:hypothetical protein